LRLRILRRSIALTAAVSVALMQSACSRGAASSSDKRADGEASMAIVPVARIVRGDIASTSVLTAEFQPFQEVDVMAKVAGYVRTIRVDLGDRVREGQVLAELEIPEMTNEISKAAAVVEQTESEIAAANDELQRADSAHQIAHLSYTRLLEVAKREPGLIPQQEVDESHSRDLVLEAQVASAKSKLRVEQNKTRVAQAEEARLRTIRNYVTIAAPFAGTVTKRYANPGSMIQAGTASQSQAMPLVRLSQVSTLRLSLPVPESLVPSVHPNEPVEVRVKSLGRIFEGRVARFAAKVDPATRTMITEVDVANPTGAIMPGMYAEVRLQVERHKGILTAPLEGLERSGGSTRAYAVDETGIVRIVPVQLGVEDAQRAEIVSGLRESDLIITGRRAGLNAGDKVKPKLLDSDR
jgi:RND family efflux transporter MFP subunit